MGWDKTFCLQFLPEEEYPIHFFGDKTHPGGDYELYEHPRITGHAVGRPNTLGFLHELFLAADP